MLDPSCHIFFDADDTRKYRSCKFWESMGCEDEVIVPLQVQMNRTQAGGCTLL